MHMDIRQSDGALHVSIECEINGIWRSIKLAAEIVNEIGCNEIKFTFPPDFPKHLRDQVFSGRASVSCNPPIDVILGN